MKTVLASNVFDKKFYKTPKIEFKCINPPFGAELCLIFRNNLLKLKDKIEFKGTTSGNDSSPSSVEVKRTWIYTTTPPYIFTA
jgi:hypothetical protein